MSLLFPPAPAGHDLTFLPRPPGTRTIRARCGCQQFAVTASSSDEATAEWRRTHLPEVADQRPLFEETRS